jgi:IS30 family transposase
MAEHKSFTVATKANVYFCDPQSPWPRGTNENTNGLLRQYFPTRCIAKNHHRLCAKFALVNLYLHRKRLAVLGQ